jgi:hypothetical protein
MISVVIKSLTTEITDSTLGFFKLLLLAALRDAIFLYDAPGLTPGAIFTFPYRENGLGRLFMRKKESFMTAFIVFIVRFRKKEFEPFPGGENENSPGF